MNRSVIINLSPRKNGTCAMLAAQSSKTLNSDIYHLYDMNHSMDDLITKIGEADTILLIGPSYVDAFPAETTYLLEKLAMKKEALHGQRVYGIIQGGMPYVHTHESGLNHLKLFCNETKLKYMGGLVFGMGAILNGQPLSKLPYGKKAEIVFHEFLSHAAKGESSPDRLYYDMQMKMPGIVCRFMVRRMNKSIKKGLMEKGIDYKQPSPYWNM